jgi:hypothetical protein
VELRSYRGPVFAGDGPHPALARLLDARDTLVEIGSAPAPHVVLGVPHHAAIGIDRIAESRPEGGRVADENAVLYALACFEALARAGAACRLLVAAHATDHDPNKRAESAYCQRALAGPGLRLLVECHGAGRRAPHDLELSAGCNPRSDPLRFGRLLARALGPGFHLAAQTAPGTRSALLLDAGGADAGASVLRFPALQTHSLTAAGDRGAAALHLEAKPRFRSRGDGSADLTAAGRRLGGALAAAVIGYLGLAEAIAAPPTGSP